MAWQMVELYHLRFTIYHPPMAEVLLTFGDPVQAEGVTYRARACGREMDDGRWEGWIEFESLDGSEVLRTGRETTQPNRTDTEYWATGLTPVYLEGALYRARHPVIVSRAEAEVPAFDRPAPAISEATPRAESVLDPFSVYRKGEAVLRSQLAALADWHLVNIIRAHALSDLTVEELERMPGPQLIELIVTATRNRCA
jgi:hypothetical protein